MCVCFIVFRILLSILHGGPAQVGFFWVFPEVRRFDLHDIPWFHWSFQEPIDWRYLPYIRPFFQGYVREYPQEIWPYMVQYLHFRIPKFPLMIWNFVQSPKHGLRMANRSSISTPSTLSMLSLGLVIQIPLPSFLWLQWGFFCRF